MATKKEYANLLDIDVNRLDQQWIEQPVLVFEYSAKYADLSLQEDDMQAAIRLERADLDAAIRENPDDYGLSKITEKAIEQVINKNKNIRKLQSELRELSHSKAILSAFLTALNHRKRALECIVELHGQSYFGSPVAKPESIAATKKRRKLGVDDE